MHPESLVGLTIHGRYRVDSVVGEGGFAVVYRGLHTQLEQDIAIKCLKVPTDLSPAALASFLERFQEEGRILSRLAGVPGIVRVFDYGVHETRARRVPFLVLEWLEGSTLEDVLASRRALGLGPHAPAQAVEMMQPVLAALASAHELSIAHRDLKPSNVFVCAPRAGVESIVKLLDFGIAKRVSASLTEGPTQTAFRAFTPGYAAPEQLAPSRYGSTGPWTDVYTAALLLAETVLGASPRASGDDLAEFLDAATNAAPIVAAVAARGASPALVAALGRALAADPRERIGDARALMVALASTPEGRGFAGSARTVRAPELAPSAGPVIPPAPARRAPRRGRSLGVGIAAALAVVVAGGAAFAWSATRGERVVVSSSQPREDAPAPEATTPSSTVDRAPSAQLEAETIYAWDVAFGRTIQPVREASASDVAGRSHVRVTRVGSRITSIARVDPAGTTQETQLVTYPSEGGWHRVVRSGAGVLVEDVTLDKHGVERHESRGGSPFVRGCAKLENRFDAAGDVVEVLCEDAEGHAIIDAAGCPVRRFEVGEDHTIATERCLREDGTPTTDARGVHLTRYSRDERGAPTEIAFFTEVGVATTDANGCYRTRFERNASGSSLVETCIGATGLPASGATGSDPVGTRTTFDEHGCTARVETIDARGRRVRGVAPLVLTSDARCNVLSLEYESGDAVVAPPAKMTMSYDAEGALLERRCFDSAGSAANCAGDVSAAGQGSVVRFRYDTLGREVSRTAFDGSGAPSVMRSGYSHELRNAYDERGLVVETSFFDRDGNATTVLSGSASRRYAYDALGAEISAADFGLDGAAIADATFVHEIARSYDDKHRLARIELFDARGAAPERVALQLEGVAWPANAVRVEIERRDGALANRFVGRDGATVATRACNASEPACYR